MWPVKYRPRAVKAIARLQPSVRTRLEQEFLALCADPYAGKPLKGETPAWEAFVAEAGVAV